MNILQVITEYFTNAWGQILWIVLLMMLDWILAVIASIYQKEFAWDKLATFLETNVLLKLVAYILFSLILAIGEALPNTFIPDELLLYSDNIVFGILVVDLVMGSLLGHMMVIGLIPKAVSDLFSRLGVTPSYALKRKVVTTKDTTLMTWNDHGLSPSDTIYVEGELVEVWWPAANDGFYEIVGQPFTYISKAHTKYE